MTEKRRRDELQSGLPNRGPTSKAEARAQTDRHGQASISEDACHAQTSATTLGSESSTRESGRVLTIGHLITEAENVWPADA